MKKQLAEILGFSTAFAKMGRYVSLVAPTTLLLTALAIWFSYVQVASLVASGAAKAAVAISKDQAPRINKHTLDAGGYSEIALLVKRNNPAAQVLLSESKASLTVFVADPAQMPELMYLLSTLQSYRPGLIWEARTICLKKCTGDRAASVELVAYTQEIVIN